MDETSLQTLKRLDPGHAYSMNPISGRIHTVVDDMAIEDPFTSECGRFPCTPDYYGVPTSAALIMVRHNMELPEAWDCPFDEHGQDLSDELHASY